MVTGAYYPEMSGAGLQCRELVRTLHDRVTFTILTTSTDPSLPALGEIDGTQVCRVPVDVSLARSKLNAALSLASIFIRIRSRFDIVHLHGFSQKSLLLILLARLFRKKLVLKLTSVGHDDPISIYRKGCLAFWCYSQADLLVGVSPRLQQLYHSLGMPRGRFCLIPNGVDLDRFRPGDQAERRALRRELRLPEGLTLILFVGFFSREKCPDLLFEAWTRILLDASLATGIVFIGSTHSRYYEVDPGIAQQIQIEAQRLGVEKQVIFIEATREIEKYYRAADLFVLPSSREGLPNALLEAMATGLPCIASRLPGVTDALIDHGVNGLLVPTGDVAALEEALRFLLEDPARAQELGRRARATVEERCSIIRIAANYFEVYQRLAAGSGQRG